MDAAASSCLVDVLRHEACPCGLKPDLMAMAFSPANRPDKFLAKLRRRTVSKKQFI
jgi:hypothetical protein